MILYFTICLIVYKLCIYRAAIFKTDMTAALATAFVSLPRPVIYVTIQVVLRSLDVSRIVPDLTFIIFTVGQQDLNLSVDHPETIKFSLNHFIWMAVENTYSHRLSVTPLALVDGSISKLTDTDAVAKIVFEHAFVLLT